ncbi:hypothetical protein ACLQ2Q_07610 [Microbacterium sp. DT81.1]
MTWQYSGVLELTAWGPMPAGRPSSTMPSTATSAATSMADAETAR